MSKQPEALRLADACDTLTNLGMLVPGLDTVECAAEIRRLHAQRDALLNALHNISLASQDSGSTREGMGLYARAAIAKAKENA